MEFNRGQTIYLSDGEHEIVGVEVDAVFVERLSDQSIKKYLPSELESLISDAHRTGWYTGPWPFTIATYLHDQEWALEDDLVKMGLSETDRGRFKHAVYEIEVELELHRNGDVYVVSLQGQPLAEKIKTN